MTLIDRSALSPTDTDDDQPTDGTLDQWSPCIVPRHGWMFVVGTITGDRKGRFDDGTLMTTSLIEAPLESLAESSVVATMNSRYRLGARAQEPGAEQWLYAATLQGAVLDGDNRPVEIMPVSRIVAAAKAKGVELNVTCSIDDGAWRDGSLRADTMTTLRKVIENFEALIGETAEAIAIGEALHHVEPKCRVPSTSLSRDAAMTRPELDIRYDASMGSVNPPHSIYVWTKSWIMFLAGDDGGTGATWVPRHPSDCIVAIGGSDEWS